MFTVLIAEKEHIDAIRQENKLFFEPFLENKELAFCYWNTAGQSLQDSVPGLVDAVGRRKDWRAVIIHNCSGEQLKTQNPFDMADKRPLAELTMPGTQPEHGENWDDWEDKWKTYYAQLDQAKEAVYHSALENALTKLGTWLCFRPENYILNEAQAKPEVPEWHFDSEEEESEKEQVKPSLRLEMMERTHYKQEMFRKETLRRAFVGDKYLNVAYPAEVHCLSVRTADTTFFDPEHYWNIRRDSDYSAFADRNLYFDKMRFLVFDLFPRTHRDYRTDYIRFLASVLVFASNPVPVSSMQARRLYQLETETDDTPLCTLVTSYDRKLAATSEIIEAEMERIRGEIPDELTDKAAEALFCTPKDVAVLLDESCDQEKVFAEKDYGLFFDHPENELHKWNRDYNDSEKALTYIAKHQNRAIRKSVSQMHLTSEVTDVNVNRLTPYQIEDIREYTDNAENEMVDAIPPDLTDISRYTDQLREESEKVKKVIRQRMTRKTVAILSAVCMALYVMCFLPFLFSNRNTPNTVTTAVTLTVITLVVLAIIMVIALIVLREKVKTAVKSYNNLAKEVLNEIQSSLRRVSKYLSASCNVRRGHSVQNHAQTNVDEFTNSLRIRKKHQEDIRKKRAFLAEGYQDYFGDRSYCDETMSRPYEFDFDLAKEYDYPAPFLAGDFRQIEFMSNGNYVTVPSSYIKRILVRMEGIYEK